MSIAREQTVDLARKRLSDEGYQSENDWYYVKERGGNTFIATICIATDDTVVISYD